MENTTAQAQEGVPDRTVARDRTGVRVKLEFPDVLGSRILLQYEDTVTRFMGTGLEIRNIDESSANFLRQFDPNLDITPGNFITSLDNPGNTDRAVRKLVGQWTTEIGDWKLDAFAASGKVDSIIVGGDATPAPVSTFLFDQTKPQTSFELVTSSPPLFGGAIEFTGGLFFLERKLDPYVNVLDIDPVIMLAMIAADSDSAGSDQLQLPPDLPPLAVPGGIPDFPPLVTVPLPDIFGLLPISTPGAPVMPAPPALHEVTKMRFQQTATSYAGYGQLTWNLAEEWAVLGGMRVTSEKRVADWNRTFETENSLLLQNLFGFREFTEQREREELLWMPKVTVRYKPAHNFSVHAHWAQGFRSGGFNADAGANVGLEYEPERSTEWAVNAKMQLLDNSLRLNIGVFRMDLQDFQLLTVEPEQRTGITVNAGSALSQGLEADFTWAPLQWLRTFGSLAYNDATFTDFKKGPCATNAPEDEDGDGDPRCDLSGVRLGFTPEWSGTVGIKSGVSIARLPLIGDSLGQWATTLLGGGVTIEYEGDQYVGVPGDELFHEPSFVRLGANLGLADMGMRWFFRISVENLANKAISRGAGPISGTNNIVSISEAPRSVFAHFALKF